MNGRNLVILAGGMSSRMKQSLDSFAHSSVQQDVAGTSKSLIGLGEGKRPFLDYLLWNAERAGYDDVVLVVREHDDAFRRQYGPADRDNPFHALRISYAVQRIPSGRTKPLGTADALLQALQVRTDWSGDACTVCNSDNLYSVGALRRMLAEGNRCAMVEFDRDALGFPPDRARQFAVLDTNAAGELRDIIEKPDAGEVARVTGPGGRVGVSMNIFRLSCALILPFLESVPLHPTRQEKELPAAVMLMVRTFPGCMKVIPAAEPVPDLTSARDIGAVESYLQNQYQDLTWQ
jgi:glucose-1-phosphate adenylyltransferase